MLCCMACSVCWRYCASICLAASISCWRASACIAAAPAPWFPYDLTELQLRYLELVVALIFMTF